MTWAIENKGYSQRRACDHQSVELTTPEKLVDMTLCPRGIHTLVDDACRRRESRERWHDPQCGRVDVL